MEKEVWTIQRILNWTTQRFTSKNISSARLDSEILLAHVLNCKRLDLYLRFDQPLKETELSDFKALVQRRSKFEPVAYITGYQEFYGQQFKVGPGVLIPRPETEQLVEVAIESLKTFGSEKINILDVGAGTGCIGLTLARAFENATVTAIEKSPQAVCYAKENAQSLFSESRFALQNIDFLEFGPNTFDLIISNPPYVGRAVENSLQVDVKNYEPAEALYGGEVGHELFFQWLPHFAKNLKINGTLLCEIGYDQGTLFKEKTAGTDFFGDVEIIKDYTGHDRILRARRISNG